MSLLMCWFVSKYQHKMIKNPDLIHQKEVQLTNQLQHVSTTNPQTQACVYIKGNWEQSEILVDIW